MRVAIAWTSASKRVARKNERCQTAISNCYPRDGREWLDGQKWYHHAIFAAYGVSPQEVGFYENSNKATGESQERITVKNAVKPYLKLIEDKINREIIPELVGHDEVKFKWFPKDDTAEKVKHEQMMAKLNANVYTINEVRAKEGLDPVEWGEQPMAMTFREQAMQDSSNDNPKEGEDYV